MPGIGRINRIFVGGMGWDLWTNPAAAEPKGMAELADKRAELAEISDSGPVDTGLRGLP